MTKLRSKSTRNIHIPSGGGKRDFDSEKPVFSLVHMRYGQPHCISNCKNEGKAHIISTLLRLSQSTWRQLKSIPHKQGFELIPRDRFTASFPSHITPETTILVAQYDGDGGRIAGYRDKDIYHIVLAGKNLYPH